MRRRLGISQANSRAHPEASFKQGFFQALRPYGADRKATGPFLQGYLGAAIGLPWPWNGA